MDTFDTTCADGMVMDPAMYQNLPYDTVKAFAPVTIVSAVGLLLVVNAALPAKSVRELIALGKQRPGQINYGAVGAGSRGVVLTGMGDDGLEGSRAIAAAGGSLITEGAATCVVYGMPKVAFEIGAVERQASLGAMGDAILDLCKGRA